MRSRLFVKTGKNLFDCLTIMTYQELEESCRVNIGYYYDMARYYYIVADECHYFMMNSTFNTKTQISFDYILQQSSYGSIPIFMSATIDRLKDFFVGQANSFYFQLHNNLRIEEKEEFLMQNNQIIIYDDAKEDDNVEVSVFDDLDIVFDEIKVSEGKWLIFVNSISNGREVEKDLQKAKIDAKFIFAGDEGGRSTVDGIATKQKFTQKVLIATSVLDKLGIL